ncbi:MAG: aminotransferase class III-fold pyridoxal phosphate-dependent enzyme [Verrucomicrobia bacterium]|nr:aminotransferase class III-fold pyridoxal phosphate-dependent enzyme [Verrucomicrobiota bacterium]
MLPHVVVPPPGPKSKSLARKLARYENRNTTFLTDDVPVFWEGGAGVNVWDVDGNRYLDLTAGFAVAGHGHGCPEIVRAAQEQAQLLYHAMGDVHPSALKAELCQKLSEVTFERWQLGPGKVTLANSGFEAVEVALKTSLLHSGKPGVIAFTGAYHGLGHGALEAIGIGWFREPFREHLRDFTARIPYPSCFRCPFGRVEGHRLEGNQFPNCATSCLQQIEEAIVKTIRQRPVGCILVEPCQGRGGEVVPPLDFLRLLRHLCDTYKILLVFDEIYTGWNRTGALFGADRFKTYPDLICVGKGLTTGFPLSACIGRAEVMDAWPKSSGEALHTSTFLGNPVGCAMALASIALHLSPELAPRVRELGRYFLEGLRRLKSPAVGHARGLGLMLGLELVQPDGTPHPALAARAVTQALQDGLLLLAGGPSGNVLSFTPPFTITREEIDFTCQRLQGYLRFGSVS